MGTIATRKRKDGSSSYQAQILIKHGSKIVHRESQTFDRRRAAAAWLERKERELEKPGAVQRAKKPKTTLADAIDRYVVELTKEIGKTKTQVLKAIKKYDIASKSCSDIDSEAIVAFANQLGFEKTEEGDTARKPQTVNSYISCLAAVFAVAKPAWGYELDQKAIKDAQTVLRHLGTISKSDQRNRRPTIDEMSRLVAHFRAVHTSRPRSNPMQKIIVFAMFSTRRLEEITRITWDDFDIEGKRVLVRDMKNPGQKIGNDIWCELPDRAIDVIKTMPRKSGRIFPYGTDAITAAFTRACQFLSIVDLHFHDLRHEGVSRLFETGKTIPQAASVSGHRSWASLQRYAHLRQTGDKWAKWRGLDTVS